jgi:alkaline phosphatase
MFKRRLILLSLIVLFVMVFSPLQAAQAPKNVIFLIGDGMGPAQVSLARISSGKPLAMDSMSIGGFAKTQSANSAVTDSAAAGTALATGHKTNNGMISTLPDGKKVGTILEAAEKMGKATGLITTVNITDATPAVFASHVPTRKDQAGIAPQLLQEKVDVILGGGKAFFMPKSQVGSKREDERDVIGDAKKDGYAYVETRDALLSAKGNELLGLFENTEMTTEAPEPTLAEMANKAISILSKDKDGFFVMIEGGQIDRKCHANDAPGAIKQTLDFSAAVGQALAFARKNGNTLVIVTADHETGGLTILGSEEGGSNVTPNFATKSHSACNVPVFAFGPGSSEFSGVLDNTDIPKKIAKLWGVKRFAE